MVDDAKNDEFVLDVKYNFKLRLILAFLILIFLIYYCFYVRDWKSFTINPSTPYSILFPILIIALIYGIIRDLKRSHSRNNFSGNQQITISNKNITIINKNRNEQEIIEWKDVKFVQEFFLSGFLANRYVLDLVFNDVNGKKQRLPLICRHGRYAIKKINVLVPLNYKAVDNKTYEDIFEFLSKKTKVKKYVSFRKGLKRMD